MKDDSLFLLELIKDVFIKVNHSQQAKINPNDHLWGNFDRCYAEWLVTEKINIDNDLISKFSNVLEILNDASSKQEFIWVLQTRIGLTLVKDWEVIEMLYPHRNNKYVYRKNQIKNIKKQDDAFLCFNKFIIDTSEDTLYETFIGEVYKLDGICEPQKNDVILDIGGFKGETAIWFADQIKNQGKIFTFEIVPQLSDAIKENIARNKLSNIIHVLTVGLHNQIRRMNINTQGPSPYCTSDKGNMIVDLYPLDEVIKNLDIEKIDFIKMDIEGCELPALEGAVETLKRYAPKLAICAYHNDNDFYDIPLYIHKILPEYKIYYSHKFPYDEPTVVFAVKNS